MYCTRCGHRNPAEARFCAKCGHPLQDETTLGLAQAEIEEETGEEVHLPLDHLQEGQGLVVVKRGPNVGSQFLIEKDVTTAGRHPESDIFLDDITVSRRHAEFRRKDDRFHLHDLGSLNGSYVNRNRVENTELASGDEIQIGKFKLMFFVGKAE